MTSRAPAVRRAAACALACLLAAAAGSTLAVSPRQLVETADISHPVVSPDGSLVAFRIERASVERNTYDTVWYVQRTDGTSPARRLGDGGRLLRESDGMSLVPMRAAWSPDGRYVYYRALLDGKVSVWRAAADGSDAKAVTNDQADVRQFELGRDGRLLKYAVGPAREHVADAELHEYDSGIHIDATVPIGQGLFRSGYLDERWATQRLFGSDVIRSPLLARVPDRWKVVDLATGDVEDLAASEAPPHAGALDELEGGSRPWKYVRDARSGHVAMLTHVEEWGGVGPRPEVELSVLLNGKGDARIRCVAESCTGKPITAIQWRQKRDEVLFTRTDPDDSQAQSIFRWDPGTGEVSRLVETNGLMNGGRATGDGCAVSAEAVICVAADANRPPRLERVDFGSGRRSVLFDPNAALAADMEDVRIERLRWKNADGRQFNGLYYPARRTGGKPPPLFITYYRCTGFVRGGVGDEWPLATLARLGISALCINAPPNDTDAVTRFEVGRSAVESIVDQLVLRGEIDRSGVGMGGLSYGTEITLWMAMNSDVLSAASVSSIAFSPLAYTLMSMSGDAFFSRLRTYWQLGAPDETPGQWRRLSPVFNLDRIDVPILMQLPEQEYLHTLDYAVPLIRAGRADLYVFPNEAHQKFQPRHKLAVYQRNLDWFRFWLQGYEDPAAAKREQYERWRSMKASVAEK